MNSNTGQVLIEVQVEDMSTLALIDTGSGVSLISSDVMKKLRGKQIFPTTKVIRNASGNVMLTSGKSKLTLMIGGRRYTHDFIISEDNALPSQIIIGIDFMKKYNVNLNTKPLKLHIEGERILIAELPMKHALLINEEQEKESIHDSEDNPIYKCSVAQASVLEGERVSYLTLETKLVESDTAIFEPVPGNVGTQFLCPGIVKLDSDKDNKRSRFVIKYINFTSENVQLEPGKTLGYVQSCKREALPSGHDQNVVNSITEKSEEEKLQSLTEIINGMYPVGTKENKILRELTI